MIDLNAEDLDQRDLVPKSGAGGSVQESRGKKGLAKEGLIQTGLPQENLAKKTQT